MGEDLNPFEPPQNVGESGPKRLTVFDWMTAIILGIFAVVLTFSATCIGLVMSVVVVSAQWLFVACLVFSLLFSLACGYMTVRKQLARTKQEYEGKTTPTKRRSFRLNSDVTGQSKLEAMLFSCAIGMISFMLMVPSFYFLVEKFGEVLRVSYPIADFMKAASSFIALAISIAIGWLFWRRIAKKFKS